MNAIEYTDFIMHHGIKGQRWGIRRYQNEDGSLTPAGKKRYLTEYAAKVDIEQQVRKDYADQTQQIAWKISKVADDGDALSKEYEKYYNAVDKDPSFIAGVKQRKEQYLAKGWSEEIAEDEAIMDLISESKPEGLINKRTQFDKEMDSAWDDIKSFVNSRIDEYTERYKDAKIYDGHGFFAAKYKDVGENLVRDAVRDSTGDTRWLGYMSRHYDDYWVNDLDSRYALEDRIRKQIN